MTFSVPTSIVPGESLQGWREEAAGNNPLGISKKHKTFQLVLEWIEVLRTNSKAAAQLPPNMLPSYGVPQNWLPVSPQRKLDFK